MKTTTRKLNIRKAVAVSVIANTAQILAMVAVLLYMANTARGGDRLFERVVTFAGFIVVSVGAVTDVQAARSVERIAAQAQMLEEAYGQLEALNGTLRKQRHDFTNHMQVIYSLVEMDFAEEALKYIESVNGDIRRVGKFLKTANPAVNALLAAKRADCEAHGIAFEARYASAWSALPVPGWEMCRVLGNLIDNAKDAGATSITIDFAETEKAYTFSVSNNGPIILKVHLHSVFEEGFTTKSEGHGSGLAIVKDILKASGGEIHVRSDESETCFYGAIPKQAV